MATVEKFVSGHTIVQILQAIDDGAITAADALAAERRRENPRSTLIRELQPGRRQAARDLEDLRNSPSITGGYRGRTIYRTPHGAQPGKHQVWVAMKPGPVDIIHFSGRVNYTFRRSDGPWVVDEAYAQGVLIRSGHFRPGK